jgi:hypothetical protein
MNESGCQSPYKKLPLNLGVTTFQGKYYELFVAVKGICLHNITFEENNLFSLCLILLKMIHKNKVEVFTVFYWPD